ncbi:hypothetical protein Prudu_000035, partial [Prunus dulcis]
MKCISHIVSCTTPLDACRSSLVSSLFRIAADSDIVWERFLPQDYKEIISTSLNSLSKKDLYFHLCNHPIIIGNGNMGQEGFQLYGEIHPDIGGGYLCQSLALITTQSRTAATPVTLRVAYEHSAVAVEHSVILDPVNYEGTAPPHARYRGDGWFEIEM